MKATCGARRATPRIDAPDGVSGANGTAARVSGAEGLVPPTLVAKTRKRYRLPLCRPLTVTGLRVAVAWAPPGDAITR